MPYESRNNNQNNNGNMNNTNANNANNTNNGISLPSTKDRERQNREKASAKAVKRAAETAGSYFGGPVGKKAADLASKTKAGQKLINQGGKVLNNIPGMGKTAKKLDDSGVLGKDDSSIKGLNKSHNNYNDAGVGTSDSNVKGEGEENNSSLPSIPVSNSEDVANESPKIAGLGPSVKNDFSREALRDSEENERAKKNKKRVELSGKLTRSLILKITLLLSPVFVIIIIILVVVGSINALFGNFIDAIGAIFTSGGEIGDIEYTVQDEKAQAFYDRINEVKLDYQSMGKNVDVLKIVAVYNILFSKYTEYTYEDMTTEVIQDIADCMFMGNTYSEDVFRDNLVNYLIPKYAPKTTDNEREQIVEDIFDYIEKYYSFIGKESGSSTCASIGSCIYDIKGFYIPSSGNVTKNMNVSNLMVRLMECGGAYGNGNDNTPIDQPLVPFEDYIMGVAYAEVGTGYPDEAIQAQMVAARSYALARPTVMGNANGKKLAEENGQWILQIASCVSDQVFCNVDEGCSYMGGGDGQGGFVRSGIVSGAVRTNPPLSQDNRLRSLAAEVQGEVVVNNQGYIINTGFLRKEQLEFQSLADDGLNYKQILMQVYNSGSRNYGASDIEKASCNNGDSSCGGSASSGPFASWKQYKGPWVDISLGNSSETIKSAGCLVTSVSMLIAKSGVDTTISDFNPGTFVEALNSSGGFSGANFIWASAQNIAPSFTFQGKINVSGLSKKEKLNRLKGLLESGFYVVAEVKGSTGQHWVAIDEISNNTILMMDPGSESTDMWGQYSWKNTSQFAYYMVN